MSADTTPVPEAATALVVTPHNGRSWRLVRPLRIVTRTHTFTVPADFVTDFASVPRLFWALFPPFGKFTIAAVAHDHLYAGGERGVTRKEADRVFLEIMVGDGTQVWRALIMYRMVRWFGRSSWNGV